MTLVLIAAEPRTCMDVLGKADPHGYIPALFPQRYVTGLPPAHAARGAEVSLSCTPHTRQGRVAFGRAEKHSQVVACEPGPAQPLDWATMGTSAGIALLHGERLSPASSSGLLGAISHCLTPKASPFSTLLPGPYFSLPLFSLFNCPLLRN